MIDSKSPSLLLVWKSILFLSGMAFIVMITPDKSWNIGIYIFGSIATFGILFTKKFTDRVVRNAFRINNLVAALVLVAALGFNFYANWTLHPNGSIEKLATLFGTTLETLATVVGIILVLAATPIVSLCLSVLFPAAKHYINSLKKKNQGEQAAGSISAMKALWILTGIYVLGISAILKADFNYMDDMGRAFYGFKNWGDYSRILANSFSTYVHMGHYIADVSPWSQIVTMFIVAASGIMLLMGIYRKISFTIWEILALVPLGLNPYFLECISYKYDSPYMALSILGAVLPLLFLEARPLVAVFATMIGTVTVCTSYQAGTGIFPMVVLFIVLRRWSQKEDRKAIGIYLAKAVSGYLLGVLFFFVIIMKPTDEAITASSNALPPLAELFPTIGKNLTGYYQSVLHDFKTVWLLLLAVLFVTALLTFLRDTKQNRVYSAGAMIILYVLWVCMTFGLYAVLETPSFMPRAMYGVGCLVTLLGIGSVEQKKPGIQLQYVVPAVLLGVMFFTFALTYGNVLKCQKEYTEFRMQQVIGDLSDAGLLVEDREISLEVVGDIGRAPIIRNMPSDYNILNRLLPQTFSGNNIWFCYKFYHYYDMKNVKEDLSHDFAELGLPVVKDCIYHRIRAEGEKVLVELK